MSIVGGDKESRVSYLLWFLCDNLQFAIKIIITAKVKDHTSRRKHAIVYQGLLQRADHRNDNSLAVNGSRANEIARSIY